MAYISNNDKWYYDTKVCILNFEDFYVYIIYDYHNIPIVDYLGILKLIWLWRICFFGLTWRMIYMTMLKNVTCVRYPKLNK
jgi:hypothetical protein